MQRRTSAPVFSQHETDELTVYTSKKPEMPALYDIFYHSHPCSLVKPHHIYEGLQDLTDHICLVFAHLVGKKDLPL